MKNKLMAFLGIVRKSGNMILGFSSVKQYLLQGRIGAMLIPDDISSNTLENVNKMLKCRVDIKILRLGLSKEDICLCIGKYVSVIGVLRNKNMIEKIESLILNEHKEEKQYAEKV